MIEGHKLKKFIKELRKIRGRHTELVTVYIPTGYDLNKIINHLSQEQGTASNIKDKTTRTNVIDSLERMIRHLRLFKKTPVNGLAVFSGNTSSQEGKQDIQVWSVEPPQALNLRMYRCDQRFVLDPLEDMVVNKETYGLIVMDNRDGSVGYVRGKSIHLLKEMHSGVPGKTKAGGQCLDPETLVQLHDGTITPMKELHNPLAVKSFDFDNDQLTNSNIIQTWKNQKQTLIFTTKYPVLRIKSSPDHTFFTYQKEIKECKAKNLKPGDLLLIPEKVKIQGKTILFNVLPHYEYMIIPSALKQLRKRREELGLSQKELGEKSGLHQAVISCIERGKYKPNQTNLKSYIKALQIEDFNSFIHSSCKPKTELKIPRVLDRSCAQVAGYFIGDGNFEEDRLSFSEEKEELAFYYQKLLSDYFNTNVSIRFREKKGYWQLRAYGRPLVRFFRKEFSKNAPLKTPSSVQKSTPDIVAAFLKGVFDANGYVSDSVALGMNCKRFIYEIQMILQRFGILSSVYEYDNRRNPYSNKIRYAVSISDAPSLKLFKSHINFTLLKNQKKLEKLISSKKHISRTRQILPAGSIIRSILEKEGYLSKDFPTVSNFFNDGRAMSKTAFQKSILSQIKEPYLKNRLSKILDYPLIPVKIHKIERNKNKTTLYDISVNKENFIANGIIVHNSSVRFARLREIAAGEFYDRISDVANREFLAMGKDLKGILLGGPGMTKEKFLNGSYLNNELKKKVIAVKDLSYTGEFGLKELLEKSADELSQVEIIKEKKIMQDFFKLLATNSDKVAYGKSDVEKALELGAVDKLLISEEIEEAEGYEEKAQKSGSTIIFISIETEEGAQLRDLGGLAAVLRFPIEHMS